MIANSNITVFPELVGAPTTICLSEKGPNYNIVTKREFKLTRMKNIIETSRLNRIERIEFLENVTVFLCCKEKFTNKFDSIQINYRFLRISFTLFSSDEPPDPLGFISN